MISIIVNAYACSPNKGSEPGMAWNWIINLAKNCKLYVITEGEWENEIEKELKNLPHHENIRFYYNPVEEKIRKMCWNQGDWRFYYYYRKWQYKALQIAKDICTSHHIDIVHQLNMIGFREPGFLWKLNKPLIWGPIDAKEKFPVAYLYGASLKQKLFIYLKNFFTKIQFLSSLRVRSAVKKADIILGSSSESVRSLKKYYNKEAILLNETGCYLNTTQNVPVKRETNELHLLWVGKFDFRKQLQLALKTLSIINNSEIKLHIVGDDNNKQARFYKSMCKKLNISHQCFWYGKIPHAKVQELMRKSDLLFFTSVAEGTPHVVLEAISNNLPVLCFDVCGQGDSVNGKIGIKIPLSNPNNSILKFASVINNLFYNRMNISNADFDIQKSNLSWNNKALQVYNYYKSICAR